MKKPRLRHRQPDAQKTDPKSEFYIPNDPENRQGKRNEARPKVARRTLLETSPTDGDGEEWRKYQARLQAATEERREPTECPVCGLTPIQALITKQRPAVIVKPGWVLCSCRSDVIDVRALKRERQSKQNKERLMILECWREDANRHHEPGGESKGRARKLRPKQQHTRGEQEWHGWAESNAPKTERLEGMNKELVGLVPKALKERLKVEAKRADGSMNLVFRRILRSHLLNLAEVHEVEAKTRKVKLKLYITADWLQLWRAKKDQLSDNHPSISDADMMASLMLEEWSS